MNQEPGTGDEQAPRPVVGIDLSMTFTGLARCVPPDGEVVLDAIHTDAPEKVRRSDKQPLWRRRRNRLRSIMEQVELFVPPGALVILEGPSYGSKGSSVHDLAGNWWLALDALLERPDLAVLVVSPSQLKKYLTGKGTSHKDAVIAAAVKRYPGIDIHDNNIADAVGLMAIGARLLDRPVEELPKVNLVVMGELHQQLLDTSADDEAWWVEVHRLLVADEPEPVPV